LVATQLGAVFCNSLRPWESSESLGVLCTNLQINVHKPLVIVFDDIDVAITKIHRNNKLMQVQKDASTNAAYKPLQIADRSEQFLVQQGIYPHVVMTSVHSPSWFHNYIHPTLALDE